MPIFEFRVELTPPAWTTSTEGVGKGVSLRENWRLVTERAMQRIGNQKENEKQMNNEEVHCIWL